MKPIYLVLPILFLLRAFTSHAQVCPGGGTNFATAVSFDPAWIYGCNTGTSCNGGVAFDNRPACEPITVIDACAPAPSCGTLSNTGSDIWFRFFASGPTALISCFQNTSLVLGVQAFKGGLTCGSLVEIGCAVSGGPSSGVQLPLSGLTPGTLYHFRIFGNANPVSQRTGLYCFCGSAGLGVFNLLPALFSNTTAHEQSGKATVEWLANSNSPTTFYIERSQNATQFTPIGQVSAAQAGQQAYTFTDATPAKGNNYYRVKSVNADGSYIYSKTVLVAIAQPSGFIIEGNMVNQVMQISTSRAALLLLSDISGKILKKIFLPPGKNYVSTASLCNGMYLLQEAGGAAQKFCVSR